MGPQKQSIGFDQIIVPTDFSQESTRAMQFALAIAKNRSQVIAVHAIDPFPYRFGPRKAGNLKRRQAWALARKHMAHWLLEGNFSRCDTRLVEGEPAPALVEFAVRKAVSLIVLATSGRRHAARFLLGSVAEEVFRQAACPVVVLGPKASLRKRGKPICLVFATDLEPHSLATVPQLSKIATRLHAKIYVVRAVSRAVRSARDRIQIRRETRLAFQSLADRSLRRHTGNICVVFVEPVKAITTFANRVDADAIVMGIRSGAEPTRAITHIPWTIAHRVISDAKCPIITLRG